ncbi:MAG: OmpA family protein [Bacteroidota bacterium]|nr:OmpA family protein [Bacteroidota bacterium]
MKKFLVYNILFLTFANAAFSQDFDKSLFKEKFIEAQYHIEYENYKLALPIFLELHKMDSTNPNINFKVGFCLLKSNIRKNEAAGYLEKAVINVSPNYDDLNPFEKKAPVNAYYYLGLAYHLNYKLDQSIETFDKFKSLISKKHYMTADADRAIVISLNAKEFVANKKDYKIDCLNDSINTPFPEYSPVVSLDESTLIFTSRRPGTSGSMAESVHNEDIYISYKDNNGVWSEAKSIGININTLDHEASIGLSADGLKLFIYKSDEGGSIWMSENYGEDWSVPEKLKFDVNSEHWETHAVITSDQKVIYFASDRPGGFGGRDIWMCKRLPNGQWAKAQNLGPEINTKYNEDAPFIHPNGKTIFFSSDGHKTMGGFDIFYSEIQEEGKWTSPENMGYPINTTDDDIYFVTSGDGKRGYFSSIRDKCKGEKDIFMVTIDDIEVEAITVLRGKITIDGGEKLPPGALIFVTDIETGIVVNESRPNTRTNVYTLALSPGPNGKTYSISYEAEGFIPILSTVEIEAGTGYQEIEKELFLHPINFESKSKGTVSLSGTIKNKQGEFINGTEIVVIDNKTGEEVGTYKTIDSLTYYFVLQLGENYNVSFEAEDYLFHSENINIPVKPEYTEIKKNIILEKIETGTKIVLNNIFFDHNKSVLRQESNVELEKLYKLLSERPEMKIEVGGHTDSKGNADVNMKLSKDRAQAVVNHLSNKGISSNRIISKGYGKDYPIAPNNLPDGKPNLEGMQQNRRVEFKILDYTKAQTQTINKPGDVVNTATVETIKIDSRDEIITKEVKYTTKSSLFGVQIGAYQKSLPSNDFPNLKNVHSFIDNDGMVRYVIGNFNIRSQAETLKKAVIEAGYKDAFIVDVNKEKKFSAEVVHEKNPKANGKVEYKVQVGAYSTVITAEAAKSMIEIEGIEEKQHGELMLLTVGSFVNIENAEKLKKELVEKGVKEAFIIAFANDKKISLQAAKEIEK